MKKQLIAFIIALISIISGASAQAWTKDSKLITFTLGASQYWNVGGYNYHYYNGYGYARVPTTGELAVQGEFGIHKYVGVGFFAGFGGGGIAGSYWGNLNIPIGAQASFHFYQLIADKVSKNIHADKLDIYAGANLGTGAGFWFANGTYQGAAGLIWGGPHAGVRYYFKENIAVNGEFGYGKTFANAGITFSLNKK